ncbi:unnamed protein product, partial [Meganyctiphanes norvegica]
MGQLKVLLLLLLMLLLMKCHLTKTNAGVYATTTAGDITNAGVTLLRLRQTNAGVTLLRVSQVSPTKTTTGITLLRLLQVSPYQDCWRCHLTNNTAGVTLLRLLSHLTKNTAGVTLLRLLQVSPYYDCYRLLQTDAGDILLRTLCYCYCWCHLNYDCYMCYCYFNLLRLLQVGQNYTLSMHFQGVLNDQLEGFYRSVYKDDAGVDRWLACTQFQSTHARKAFPCLDEPSYKATFQVWLARTENMTAVSNMPRISSYPIADQPGWTWDEFGKSVPMSTYLLAFMISDLHYRNSTSNDHVFFRVWARENALDQVEYALEKGPDMLRFYEDFFNISFPLPKQDMVALPDFGPGAMENWGLINYRETLLLLKPSVSSAADKINVAQVMSHELAHMWFGNLVTAKWWDDLWLNEGFATFLQYLGTNSVEPSWNILDNFLIDGNHNVMGVDSLENSHPMRVKVGRSTRELNSNIIYRKGSAIIRMMGHFLSEKTLRKGLSTYLEELKYDNAEQDDLWHYLTQQAHNDGTLEPDVTVKMIMDTWTLQSGYPVITVERDTKGTTATIKQERFLKKRSENSSCSTQGQLWWVPLSYTTKEESNFHNTVPKRWMKNSETSMKIESLPEKHEWVIFNLQETGYYRVNYDLENWYLLIHQLRSDHSKIHAANRAQIIDDSFDLASAGLLPISTALSVYSYLLKETDFVPWEAAMANMNVLKNMFIDQPTFGALRSYLLSLLIPLYNSIGFEDDHNDHVILQQKRHSAVRWACYLKHNDCNSKAKALFNQWMQSPSNSSIISSNVRGSVLCAAIRHGGELEWTFAWNQYLNSNSPGEKIAIQTALGCTKKVWLLIRYLDMAFTAGSGVRKQDSAGVFTSVANNPIGQAIAWSYLRNNAKRIYKYIGSGYIINQCLYSATRGFKTHSKLKEVGKFHSDVKHILEAAGGERVVREVTETISYNIQWMANHYQTITNWLNTEGYSSKLPNA